MYNMKLPLAIEQNLIKIRVLKNFPILKSTNIQRTDNNIK